MMLKKIELPPIDDMKTLINKFEISADDIHTIMIFIHDMRDIDPKEYSMSNDYELLQYIRSCDEVINKCIRNVNKILSMNIIEKSRKYIDACIDYTFNGTPIGRDIVPFYLTDLEDDMEDYEWLFSILVNGYIWINRVSLLVSKPIEI